MSIEKITISLQAKLREKHRKKVAETSFRKNRLNNEDFEILSLVDGKRYIKDLARLLKKEINYILKKAVVWEDLGIINLKFLCEDPILKRLYESPRLITKIYKQRPDMCNIVAYEKEWNRYPRSFDFLNRDSDFYRLKDLEKEIYLKLMLPFLKRLPDRAVILDAGGGIGRFTCEFLKMGHKVHLLDSSLMALKKALRHLLDEGNPSDFDLYWADATNLSMFADNTFDSSFAMELVCYCSNPTEVIKELVRVTKKKGLIVVSVEGKYGGMLSDPNVCLSKMDKIFHDNLLYIKNYLYVQYYTKESLYNLLKKCGVEVLDISGCQYVTEGIFHRLIEKDKMGSKKYREDLLKLETLCQKDHLLRNLARAWVAVGRKN